MNLAISAISMFISLGYDSFCNSLLFIARTLAHRYA